ncbi:MAG: hypothetical protein KAJ19_18990 [Gammaproteobacteria bacterium]|nr:hypothetical protein [Gammaproteobacteria bacterium]
MNKTATILLAILLFANLSTSPTALAWNPTTSGLSGTNTSPDTSVAGAARRFDIDSATAGIWAGEDADSIAFTIQLMPKSAGQGFKANGHTVNDQYEIDFTIGETDFAIFFIATAAAAGIVKVFYKATGGPTWLNGETHSQSGIGSGSAFRSVSLNIGFTLTSSGASADGLVTLVVTKNYLATLGATFNTVTGIFAANFASSNGDPGGGVSANDRCPTSSGASWTLSEAIPDFSFGTLILMLPVISIYLILTRRKNNGIENRSTLLPEHLLNSSKLQYLLVIVLLVTIAYSIQRQTSVIFEDEEVEGGSSNQETARPCTIS